MTPLKFCLKGGGADFRNTAMHCKSSAALDPVRAIVLVLGASKRERTLWATVRSELERQGAAQQDRTWF
jgi:hypothetical protein